MTAPLEVGIHHWKYSNGAPEPVAVSAMHPTGRRETPPAGWYCWAYPNDDALFVEWMARECPSADMCHRYNSGDPMFSIYFSSAQEALRFQSAWEKIYSLPVL